MTDDDKIKPIGVRFKTPPVEGGVSLKVVDPWSRGDHCNHQYNFIDGRMVDVTYLIRDGETEVECGHCNTKLDPVWVLLRLANMEAKWNRTREVYQAEMQRLRERSRTKCEKCGHMTRISQR